MSIDWITVAAQLVNFLVLVWLLKRFLYGPILAGIDAREAAIAARMGEAARIREAAKAAESEHRAEAARLKEGREGALAQVRREAEAERDALLAEARDRIAREQATRAAERENEARRYAQDLHHKGATALIALLRKALDDLAGETLEERIVARALSRLPRMTGDLRDAAGDSRDAVVTTQRALSDDLRSRIGDAVAGALPGTQVRFTTDETLSPGLSLRLGGAQLGWTVDGYVDGLQDMLDDASTRRGHSDAA
ncbi:F0F1 ATP synthase subunit B [Oceaniglobus indicus]|uniref:F0F1 ATP synthase subunit B family protein n=1 Tax=Oceaniglobus indicus TaxID=2047749 RepID=UPI000C17F348|nr:F0F1 ATP synthase subunit B [Oceaniglobus indicus]